jgi:rod shape-determining protein MreC
MNTIFSGHTSAERRLVIVLCLSILLIYLDHSLGRFDKARGYLQSLVSPLQYLANTPKQLMNWATENLSSRQQLIQQNQQYQQQVLLLKQQLLEFDIIKRENARLRALLAVPVREQSHKMVAEILSVDSDPFTHQIVINRGVNDGVYEGQPVLDEQGVVGQVLHVGAQTSRVLLITDLTHAIPVRVQRNGVRLVASGTGKINLLVHNFVPHSTDIKIGDVLVSSGLGGRFPEGYPVSIVTQVVQDKSQPFARVYSEPVANIDRLRYLLLIWPENKTSLFAPANSTLESH